MGKTLEPYVKNANRLELKHKASFTGRIAALQQEGGAEQMSKQRMARIHGKPDYNALCSRAQARALATEGYQIKRKKAVLIVKQVLAKSWPMCHKAKPR